MSDRPALSITEDALREILTHVLDFWCDHEAMSHLTRVHVLDDAILACRERVARTVQGECIVS